jgi:hypothetical protein
MFNPKKASSWKKNPSVSKWVKKNDGSDSEEEKISTTKRIPKEETTLSAATCRSIMGVTLLSILLRKFKPSHLKLSMDELNEKFNGLWSTYHTHWLAVKKDGK